MNDIAAAVPVREKIQRYHQLSWPLKSIELAGLHWPSRDNGGCPKILVHGWLDNSLSFNRLAPELADLGNVFAIDMAGHGHSGHRPEGQSYQLMDYVADLAELLDRHFLGSDCPRVDLIGHSLGGIVSVLYAAAFPENVRRLVMIDSLGPISRPPPELVGQLRKAIKKRIAGSGRQVTYPDLESAARARAGGLSPLSPHAAMTLVPRNMREVPGGYVWRTDPRLRHPSMLMLDEEQVLACLKSVVTDTLFIRAREGLFAQRDEWQLRQAVMGGLQQVCVPGGHHCHLDGDIGPVVTAIRGFIKNAD